MASDLANARTCNVCLLLEGEQKPHGRNPPVFGTRLSKCCGCQLVLYCSVEHQRLDWPLHRDFCRAVQKILASYKVSHPFLLCGQPMNAQDMENVTLQLKYLLRIALGRSLQFEEEEFTSFPLCCAVCYSFKRVITCPHCRAVSYCTTAHAERDEQRHKRLCGLLQIYYCPYKTQPISNADEIMGNFPGKTTNLQEIDLVGAIQLATLKWLPAQPIATLKDYQHFAVAADFSYIGTLCYALSFMDMSAYEKKKLVIFIVGASMEQEIWFLDRHMKFFFLQYPKITWLDLYFIGPECVGPQERKVLYNYLGNERIVNYHSYSDLFQRFSEEHNIKPSLIIAYNCGFSEYSHRSRFNEEDESYTDLPSKTYSTTVKNTDSKKSQITAAKSIANEKELSLASTITSSPSAKVKCQPTVEMKESLITQVEVMRADATETLPISEVKQQLTDEKKESPVTPVGVLPNEVIKNLPIFEENEQSTVEMVAIVLANMHNMDINNYATNTTKDVSTTNLNGSSNMHINDATTTVSTNEEVKYSLIVIEDAQNKEIKDLDMNNENYTYTIKIKNEANSTGLNFDVAHEMNECECSCNTAIRVQNTIDTNDSVNSIAEDLDAIKIKDTCTNEEIHSSSTKTTDLPATEANDSYNTKTKDSPTTKAADLSNNESKELSMIESIDTSTTNTDETNLTEMTDSMDTADTWTRGIMQMLLTYDLPIVFTSYTKLEADFDYGTLLHVAQGDRLQTRVERIFPVRQNPFRDLRPLRNWQLTDSEEIYYRNGYIQMVRTSVQN